MSSAETTLEVTLPSTEIESKPLVITVPNDYKETIVEKFTF